MKNKAIRILCFVLGIITNSFGIACITKGALGTSPISSVPYVFSLQFAPSFGLFTFIVNVVFSVFIDLSMAALAWLQPQTLPLQVLTVALGSTIMAFGICLEVTPAILLVPGEGVVNAISRTFKLEFGNVKIGFDLTLLLLALVLSLVFWGRIRGLGLGTIISALLVGKLVKVFHQRLRWFTKLEALKSA